MKKLFLDANVILDVLLHREPFFITSANVISLSRFNDVTLYASCLTFANCLYVARKHLGYANAIEQIRILSKYINVSNMDGEVFNKAINTNSPDFEDTLQYFSALSSDCDAIITRNKRDFPFSEIAIFEPEEIMSV